MAKTATNPIADIEARMAALRAAPKTHYSVMAYSDGSERRAEHISEKAAELSVQSYRPLVGKHEYISRATGLKIKIVSIEVGAL